MNERIDSIRDLKPQQKQLSLVAIVLEISKFIFKFLKLFNYINYLGPKYFTKDNHEIRTIKVADRTGSVNVCVYDEPGSHIQPGDILRLTKW